VDNTDRVAVTLACSALDQQLAGLLFLDLDPALIYPLARWLADLLGEGPRDRPQLIPIGPGTAEEQLWERIAPDRAEHPEDLGVRWVPGPLAGYERSAGIAPPGIVVVSDLARVGLPAARAAVTLLDAEVAHLERSGVARMWHPMDRWLAALRRQDVGRVSAHLLDRFAVRVDAGDLRLPGGGGPILAEPDPAWRQAVLAVRRGADLPALSADAADQVVARVPPRTPGARRSLALARLARALAALAGEPEVRSAHVHNAAQLIGLNSRQTRRSPAGKSGPARSAQGPARVDEENGQVSAIRGDDPSPLETKAVDDLQAWADDSLDGPYPEDVAKPQRDVTPLRIGWQRALTGPPRGAPIGTQRTLDKRDIAVTATLLNAAPQQRLRCPRHYQEHHRLHVRPQDLLSYRRAPRPGHLLILLLDHTCRAKDWNWYVPLAPYLRWAYVNRALVGVVQMGAAADDVTKELRATQFRSRSVLDPKVAKCLEDPPARASTPLAHGLTLAAGMLRHDTQQAGALVGEAFLVVVTDGRANVPLAASQAALPPALPVGGSAVADAEAAARKIGALRRVSSAVIYPGPVSNGHLAARLAIALAAPLVHGSPSPAVPDSAAPAVPPLIGGAA
jgi:magnesium chelatase subunit D